MPIWHFDRSSTSVHSFMYNKKSNMSGDIVLNLIAKRQRKLLYLTHGQPQSLFRSLLGAEEGRQVAQEFSALVSRYEWAKAREGVGGSMLKAMLRRC